MIKRNLWSSLENLLEEEKNFKLIKNVEWRIEGKKPFAFYELWILKILG
jgi:hypothetical protein